MEFSSSPDVLEVINKYPPAVRTQLIQLRQLIIDTASEMENLKSLDETLKWGEPSFLTKYGSTVRIDWKSKTPDQYAIYFKCTSKLIPTFKSIFGAMFRFENNRAIIFRLNDQLPKKELKQCIAMAFNYHKLKHLPLLGYKSIG